MRRSLCREPWVGGLHDGGWAVGSGEAKAWKANAKDTKLLRP